MSLSILKADASITEKFVIVSVTDEQNDLVAQCDSPRRELDAHFPFQDPSGRISPNYAEVMASCFSLLKAPSILRDHERNAVNLLFVYDNLTVLSLFTESKHKHVISFFAECMCYSLREMNGSCYGRLVNSGYTFVHKSVVGERRHDGSGDWSPGLANTRRKRELKRGALPGASPFLRYLRGLSDLFHCFTRARFTLERNPHCLNFFTFYCCDKQILDIYVYQFMHRDVYFGQWYEFEVRCGKDFWTLRCPDKDSVGDYL